MPANQSLLLLDPWTPDHESAIPMEGPDTTTSAEVDPTVESADWAAIPPDPAPSARPLYFVDGVRRVDARVLTFRNGQIVHGIFGCLAVGAVRAEDSRARFDKLCVSRYMLMGGGLFHPETLHIGATAIPFEAFASAAASPLEVTAVLQNRMRQAEAELGESLLSERACVFVDGPLNYFSAPTQALVGVIKRIYVPYLSAAHLPLVAKLSSGERTPLFSIRDGRSDRYSWFLRLASGRAIDHPLAGVVRLEVRAALGLETARQLAGLSAAVLPRFASNAVRDPRAPQNLLPVGALEEELRRRMGDPLLFRRAIERKLSEGVLV
jgi:uncharacterized protein